MKKLKHIAAITMARNDEFFLSRWVAYYGRELGIENLYIILDGTDQVPPKNANGANIIVNGSLNVGGKLNSTNTSYTGCTTGEFGYIYMNSGSTITLNNGSYLYCWGYIYKN